MTATSNVSTHAIPEAQTDVHPLNTIAVFCALVIGASLCLATYGSDLSAGIFLTVLPRLDCDPTYCKKLNLWVGG